MGFKPRWELREVQGLDGEVPYDGIDTIGVVSKTLWTVLGDIGSRAHDVLVLASQLTSVDKGFTFLVAWGHVVDVRVVFETRVPEIKLIPTSTGSNDERIETFDEFVNFLVWDDEVARVIWVQVEVEEAEAVGECIASVVTDVLFDAVSYDLWGYFQRSASLFGQGLYTLGSLDNLLFAPDSEKVVIFDSGFLKPL